MDWKIIAWIGLIALVLLGGCAQAPAPREPAAQAPATPPTLPAAQPPQEVRLEEGTPFTLAAQQVTRTVAGKEENLLAYNGQLPGPLLRAKQGQAATIEFKNELPYETTVHWHGLRLDNAFDGVPDVTQKPVKPGESFRYELKFPDPGLYWYHPHLREDRQQELGLYGAILVEPAETDYYGKADREEVLILDDLRLNQGGIEGFSDARVNYAMMGRYGNTMMVNWDSDYRLKVRQGETLRLFLLNAANARPFNFTVEGTAIKWIGSDNGKAERAILMDSVVLGPSERAVIELTPDKPGEFKLLNQTPNKAYALGTLEVEAAKVSAKSSAPKENPVLEAELEKLRPLFGKASDYELELDVKMQGMMGNHGMMMPGMQPPAGGIEWEEDAMMGHMNAMATDADTQWIIRDKATGKENMDLTLQAKVGEVMKLRIHNDKKDSMHPMQHPIHLHGTRFLVLSLDGKPNDNLAWKDTVLIPTGSYVDLLTEFSNPGKWMLHCHIAEHLHSGMMAAVEVTP